MLIKVKKLIPEAIIPKYVTPGAACFDLHAIGSAIVYADRSATFRTGLSFEIPAGSVMLIFSRSGHGFKNNVRLANCTGVIDSDYRGEVQVKLTNDDGAGAAFSVVDGDRIAQAMVLPIEQVTFEEVTALSTTERGEGGFGSTGSGAL
jgi:dUTP pyrophosphatase